MASSIYGERHVLDMRSFGKISPALCAQVVRRFSSASLRSCYFKCDVFGQSESSLSLSLIEEIVGRFLDNYRCDEDLVSDLHTALATDNADWFPGAFPTPWTRPIDVLAHCFLLDSLLSCQPSLMELHLDIELGIFRLPRSKGYRKHWHLMYPFLALQSIQRYCPCMHRYTSTKSAYQSSTVDIRHVQMRFLENSKKLRYVSNMLELDVASLERYELLKAPLVLEKAAFLVSKCCGRVGDGVLAREKLRSFSRRFPHLKSAALAFSARGALLYAAALLRNLKNVTELLLKCDFNPGYPSFDIDEGPQMGGFFEGFLHLLPANVQKLNMLNIPEAELSLVLGASEAERVPTSLKHLRASFSWSSTEVRQEHIIMLIETFFDRLPSLRTLCIEIYFHQENQIFFKKLSRALPA
ncbi:hypothetical protein KP509_30G001800 [Ceratopteris richardii]|nr:hypothetical protein KP509_30G001800 [Ceratopteris richardii]